MGGPGGRELVSWWPEVWGPPGPGGNGGAGSNGLGAAIFSVAASRLVNCTLAQNVSAGGTGGGPGFGQGSAVAGAAGWGSEVISAPVLYLTNCTLAANSGTVDGALGGGTATLANTLLAANLPANADGPVADGGHNLSSDASCAFTSLGSLNHTDPKLGPLADNGGPTQTMALLPGSPAIGAGDGALAPTDDQRGFPRPPWSSDIGAFQSAYPPLLQVISLPQGGLGISAYGLAGQSCRLLASPDLVQWTVVATNQFNAQGAFVFSALGGAAAPRCFYRVVSP